MASESGALVMAYVYVFSTASILLWLLIDRIRSVKSLRQEFSIGGMAQ